MKVISSIVFRFASFLTLLLASPFSGWNSAYTETKPEHVELQITDEGVRVVRLEAAFYAPYTVEPGDTFQSISTKFYGSPEYAKNLADALSLPVVHIPRPGSIVYILSRSIDFRFSRENRRNQRKTVEEFLAMLPKDKRLEFGLDGNPSFTVTDTGQTVLTRFDVKTFHLTPVNQSSTRLELKFPLQPLLNLIRASQVLQEVAIRREDTKSKAD